MCEEEQERSEECEMELQAVIFIKGRNENA
jgi:hypothetical protein